MIDNPDANRDSTTNDTPRSPHARYSDRVPIELTIQVWGTDGQGRSFREYTRTAIVSRHGAKILLSCQLQPEQKLVIRSLNTGLESDACIVGQLGGGPGQYFYGIKLLDQALNVWGIEFPPITESEKAVARVLMECGHCRSQEVICLNEFEVEVYEASGSLSRHCRRCSNIALWKQVVAGFSTQPPLQPSPAELPPATAAGGGRTENERQDFRVRIKMRACIRPMGGSEEVVTTVNVSRGGVCLNCANRYAVGTKVEVAIPYTPGAANIFAPARIVHVEDVPAEGRSLCGVGNVYHLLFD